MKASIKITCSFFLMLVFSGTRAQSYYFNSPFVTGMDTSTYDFSKGIEIINTGTVNLDFTWELVLKDTLADSHFELCNSGICQGNLAFSGIMPTIVPGDKGWLKLHMFAGKVSGINHIKYVLKKPGTQDTLNFYIIVGNATGIKNNAAEVEKIKIYPNPVDHELNLEDLSTSNSELVVELLGMNGELLLQKKFNAQAFGNRKIDVERFENGLYFLRISSGESTNCQKILIRH